MIPSLKLEVEDQFQRRQLEGIPIQQDLLLDGTGRASVCLQKRINAAAFTQSNLRRPLLESFEGTVHDDHALTPSHI